MSDVVLLDLGGVLVDIDPGRTVMGLALATGIDPEEVFERLESSKAHEGIDTGELTPAGLHQNICDALGQSIEYQTVIRAWASWVAPMSQADEVIERLAKRHDLYLLSNTDPIHVEEVRRFGSQWLKRFDGLFLSYEHGILKPDPSFFHKAIDAFALDRERCVFLDDVKENVDSAMSVGFTSHQVPAGGLTLGLLEQFGLG